ncbi:hypothetical protein [Phaeobacter gallaeciensis]|uniref:hypothetical protein n=1 Tax=Phaeobacter gallaeciensis TaxID=60890 RepID=UPI0003D6C4E2|nr:hypothetical protein [Phaeobacter gallaeciensis]AHD12148.1 hypothetical protein Gal_04444 [Phaeobacter gallaeciensis DSM 26640]ATE95332.1 hypothetical protein PhaeoP11_04348 [Phaeobacter gallaeciensis]
MKNVIVKSTRRTKIGTFRPGIVYKLDETKQAHQAVILSLTEGKDDTGRKTVDPVGAILTDSEVKAYMEKRSQSTVQEISKEIGAKAEGEGAVNTVSIAAETERAEKAEAAVKDLQAELSAIKLEKSEQEAKVSGLKAEVSTVKEQMQQLEAALEDAKKHAVPADGGKGGSGSTSGPKK